eukprot:TRINITY_DN244_c0_g1_i2.p1 TRINITY_DN244_c0_g1~~TRINITY_DN244_c0_g1_i2.p1  ORF type:complete len:150 (+),score=33.06 TRINITY_DN244_c0_g1_i2:960-1409(+)
MTDGMSVLMCAVVALFGVASATHDIFQVIEQTNIIINERLVERKMDVSHTSGVSCTGLGLNAFTWEDRNNNPATSPYYYERFIYGKTSPAEDLRQVHVFLSSSNADLYQPFCFDTSHPDNVINMAQNFSLVVHDRDDLKVVTSWLHQVP